MASSSHEETESLIKVNRKNEKNFHSDFMIDFSKIRNTDFNLNETHNLRVNTDLKSLISRISRKNIIYFGIMTAEEAVPIESCSGDIIIPLIQTTYLRDRLSKIKPSHARKISWIHLSTLQIILKSTFTEKIDSLVNLILRDDRIIDPNDSIIAKGSGNLGHGKIKFDVNIKLGISLQDSNLNRTITLRYHLLRENFMVSGNHPFSIAYRINYALTNSHHSLTFKDSPRISIDKLFESVINLEEPSREMSQLNHFSISAVHNPSVSNGIRARERSSQRLLNNPYQRQSSLRIVEDRPELSLNRSLALRPPLNIVGRRSVDNSLLERIENIQREVQNISEKL